ncbi:MAG: DUF5659 domain-containing protein [Tepidibacter sp.]|jgi:hypothetical protein|uniref:DUF5659 domain-containing protein n=1 Tax=Tepidibacter sp. TaxID=2529387 RepID=UPI0025D9094B|nr:DUF5659 domain-containing protein [Tepidibacter sp.]MCT4507843.1 DUF5659 domain-containing protein [Tepidibacter sp.]
MKLKEITDIDLIVFLVTKGHLINKSKKEGNKSIIYFEDNKELQKNILKFVNRNENINISDYQAAHRRVKTLLYANKN